jgi:hypothetical protein
MLSLTPDHLAKVVAPPTEIAEARRPALLDLSPEVFQMWRREPVTQQVLLWLEDLRDSLLREALRAFLAGEMDKVMIEEFRGRALMCSELVALELGDIMRWYYGDTVPPPERRV